jgi:predicted permease
MAGRIVVIPQLRRWRRHPLLAAHHLATISIGMAAVTAVVSLMLAIAFRPLPFRDSAQLIEVWNRVQSGTPVESLSGAELTEIHDQAKDMFASVGGFTPLSMWLLDDQRGSAPVRIVRVEETGFRALDLTPVLGRSVAGNAANPAGLGPVWISYELWQTRYGGSPAVIGASIRIAQNEVGLFEAPAEVAGVLPRGVRIPSPGVDRPVDLWAILPDDFKLRAAKVRAFFALGRLRPDRTLAEVQAALTVVADRRPRLIDRNYRPVVQGFEEIAYGPVRRTIGVVAVGVGLVLLLAFANLASLTVAEGSRRRLELSLRAALGATRWQLWRGLVAEHVTLTACGLGLGLPLALVTLGGLTRLVTLADIGPPLAEPPALNMFVMLGFAAWAVVATLVWATLIVRGAQADHPEGNLSPGHLSGVTRLSSDRRAGFWRLSVLSGQACLGLALMVLAVSMARTYMQITAVNLGPAPDRTTFFRVSPTAGGAPSDAQAADFTSQVRSLARSLPNVQTMATTDSFPPYGSVVSFSKPGDAAESSRQTTSPLSVSHDYFSTLGIPILHGRGFDHTDRYAGKPVAVIDREMARLNWASPEEAVAAQIKIGARGPYEVIGVVDSFGGYWAQSPVPTVYLSQDQQPSRANVVILRTTSTAPNIAELARQVFSNLPVGVEISASTTLQAGWQSTSTGPRARMIGMLLLALIGVALAAQGVYALAASNVATRRQELAIRTALGASGTALVWLVLRQMIVAVVIGLSIGVMAVLAVHRLAPHWISVALNDPAAPIALGSTVLLLTAVLGGLVPARSATRPTSVAWLR